MSDEHKLSKLEQETHFNQSGVDRMEDVVYITTDDPVWIRKLEGMGFIGKKYGAFGSVTFVCEDCTMNVRKKTKRNLTDEQRAALAERMRNVQEKRI